MKVPWLIVALSLIAHGVVVVARWQRKRGEFIRYSQPRRIDDSELGVA